MNYIVVATYGDGETLDGKPLTAGLALAHAQSLKGHVVSDFTASGLEQYVVRAVRPLPFGTEHGCIVAQCEPKN